MKARVTDALHSARNRLSSGASFIPASRLAGSELIHLGGGEMVSTPGVGDLPLFPSYRSNGLSGDSLALPPANVRILKGVHIVVGENVVRLPSGTVVGESVSSAALRLLPRRHKASRAHAHPGRCAPYGSPGAGAMEGLVEALPRALLLQHPALRSFAPIALLCSPTAPLVESWLRGRLDSNQVVPESVSAGQVVEPEITVVAAPVSRAGAGAIPRWYRRWLDVEAAAAGESPTPRRLLLTHGSAKQAPGSEELSAAAQQWDLTIVRTDTGDLLDGDGSVIDRWSATQTVAAIRDATLVVGADDDALGHVVVSRRAQVVHVGLGDHVTPRVLQLAESRGLPYRFVRRTGLASILSD